MPFGPGGATFVSAKFLELCFEKHLPGNSEINVIDLPGGGSILGANWFEQTPSRTARRFVRTRPKGRRVPPCRRPRRLKPPLQRGGVRFADDRRHVGGRHQERVGPLILGGIAAAASDLPGLLSFEVLDLPVKSVLGFNGRGPVRLAFEQGSVNLDYQFTPVYLTQVVPSIDAGQAVALWTGGSVDEDGSLTARDPIAPDLPSVYEDYSEINGEAPSGIEWDAFEGIASVIYAYGLTA